MLSQNFSFDEMPYQFSEEISRAIVSYLPHLGRGLYQVFAGKHWLASFPSAIVALLRKSNRPGPFAAWFEVHQSFELPGPEWDSHSCRKYALR
jgi:hypothetical protein